MRRVWRRCDFHFRTEETESSTVRLVLGSCDGLALLVRDDALNLTLSRPSSGFGTFQLETVRFRKPNWVAYRKPLRSSFCTRLSSSMSCDVVCFFLPGTSEGFFDHRRGSKAMKHWPGCGLWIFCDKRSLQRQVQLFVRSPYFAAVCLSQSRNGGR